MPEPTRRNFGIRLPVELIEAIEARAAATGQSKTQITEAALCAYLGLEVGTDGPDLVQRLADVEQRLTDVEQRLTVSAQRRHTPPSATPATAPTEGAYRADGAGHPRADGQRWLTTKQAVQVSAARGGPETRSSLLVWARNGRLSEVDLRHCPHRTKDKTLASFEDLRFEG